MTSKKRKMTVAATVVAIAVAVLSAGPVDASTAPTAAFNPAPTNGGRNVALIEAGAANNASVVAFSSQFGTSFTPTTMLNLDTSADAYWATGNLQLNNQFVTVLLGGLTAGGTATHLIDRVVVQPSIVPADQRVRDFAVDVSTTDTLTTSFTTVLTATAANNSLAQEFALPAPVQAKYVRYRPLNNRGSTCCISTESFRVMTGQSGSATVVFQDLSTDPDDDITGYVWDFGDGSPTSTEQNPTHTFPAIGTYTVTLTVTDAEGFTGVTSLTQVVQGLPGSGFTKNVTSPNEGQSITFSIGAATDANAGVIQRRVVEWADGTNTVVVNGASAFNTSHTFADNSTYAVKLHIVDSQGDVGVVPMNVPIANVAPTVSAGADRKWVAGERLVFNTTITDPGSLDTRTCTWDWGDGTPPTSPPCGAPQFDHTFVLPSGVTSERYTATLTATDKDGGVGFDRLDVQVFPQMFSQAASALPNIAALAWSPVHDAFVVVRDQTSGNRVQLVDPDPSIPPRFLTGDIASVAGETHVAVAPGSGGFHAGDIFVGNGRPGEIVRIRMKDDGTVDGIDNPWVTVRSTGQLRGGLTFDDGGRFDGDLIAVFSDGRIYQVDASGAFELVEDLRVFLEGADIAPAGFGSAAGCVLTTEPTARNVWSVCPSGTPFVVTNIATSNGTELEGLVVADSAGDYAFADFDQGRIWLAPSPHTTQAIAGHVLVHSATTGEVFDLTHNDVAETFDVAPFTMAVRPAGGAAATAFRMEQATFIPALHSVNSVVAPFAAAHRVGDTHTASATLVDTVGNPVPDVVLDFEVTGANPRSATATTDENGVALFSYTGTASGTDQVRVSSRAALGNVATVTWSKEATDLDVAPVIAHIGGTRPNYFPSLAATLTESGSELGVAGKQITFLTGSSLETATEICQTTTNTDGEAICGDVSAAVKAIAGLRVYARFDGDTAFAASVGEAPIVRVRFEE